MKTRQEMIYDFMVVLASNLDSELDGLKSWEGDENIEPDMVNMVYVGMLYRASKLADTYLESLNERI